MASLDLPFPVYLSMLTPMRIRQYSISSSPLNDPTKASVMYSVVNSGTGRIGVATNYLKALQPGSIVQLMVKKSHASFHLPRGHKTPIIMVCAGTGLAPFMGFVQERAARIAASGGGSEDFGEAILIIGCRYPDRDRLFDEGARAYICGSSSLGKGVREVAAKMAVEGARKKGKEVSYEQGLNWWEGLRGERYAVDVFD